MGNHEQPERAVQEVTHKCTVYALRSSEVGDIRYIGQTMQPLAARLSQHIAEAERKRLTRCHRWINSVRRRGFEVQIEPIEVDAEWNSAERKWIAHYRAATDLLNHSDGGCGYSGRRSRLTRWLMSRPKSEATRQKMRKPKSPATRQKMAVAQKGNTKGRGSRNGNAVLTEQSVREIKGLLTDGWSLSRVAARYGVQKPAVWKIKTGQSWAHVN